MRSLLCLKWRRFRLALSLSLSASHVQSWETEPETEPRLGFGFCLQCPNDVVVHRTHDYYMAQIELYAIGKLSTTVVGDGTLIHWTSLLVLRRSIIMYSLTKPPVLMSWFYVKFISTAQTLTQKHTLSTWTESKFASKSKGFRWKEYPCKSYKGI